MATQLTEARTRQWQKVRVSWDTASDEVPVFTGYWDGQAWGSGIVVWFARDEAERLVDWQNDAHAHDPDSYADYFTRTEDGGYRGHSSDYPSEDYDVLSTSIPEVGTVWLLGDGWTWADVDAMAVRK